MMTIIYDCSWISPSGVSPFEVLFGFAFHKSPAQCSDAWEDRTLTQPCPVGGRGAQWEFYFRTSLDHWAVVIGMLVAYIIATLNLRAQKAFSFVSTAITVIIGAGLLVAWVLYYPTSE